MMLVIYYIQVSLYKETLPSKLLSHALRMAVVLEKVGAVLAEMTLMILLCLFLQVLFLLDLGRLDLGLFLMVFLYLLRMMTMMSGFGSLL
jgi:hypothetical protein